MGRVDGRPWGGKIFTGEWAEAGEGTIQVVEPATDIEIASVVIVAAVVVLVLIRTLYLREADPVAGLTRAEPRAAAGDRSGKR